MRVLMLPDYHSRILVVLCIAIISAGHSLADSAIADRKDTWGHSPELTAPKSDSKGRAGRWWWPKPLDRGNPGTTAKGNGGRVFSSWTPVEETLSVEPVPPYPGQPQPREPERHLILNNIIFPNNSADLTIWAKADLDRTAEELTWYFEYNPRYKIICIGHTDDIGSEPYNIELGLRRAKAVADYLVTHGIGDGYLQVQSVGESKPLVPNDTPQNRALNRCVEYRIVLPPEVERFKPSMK